jgi:hypothetical protein
MKYNTMAASFGLYYTRFHAKDFYLVTGLSPLMVNGEMVIDNGEPVILPDYYYFLYHEDIDAFAASANLAWGQYTFAAEVTYRSNVPLQSAPAEIEAFHIAPEYATGDTLSVILNTFSGGMRGNFFCDSQDLIAEIAYVTELSADNEDLITDGYDKDAIAAQISYTPTWYQVMPGLTLNMPLGVSYTRGNPSTLLWGAGASRTGSFNIALAGTYEEVWDFELMYRNYFGEKNLQALDDRDYVSFYIRRTF